MSDHNASPTVAMARRRSWDWRPKLRWFAAEFLVVVAGVLAAIAVNAWYEGRREAASEDEYLSLLSNDIQNTVERLEEVMEFEGKQIRDGLTAYHTLSSPKHSRDLAATSSALQRLIARRTLTLRDPTYQDLISTGNLRLIRNTEVRNRIVDFFEGTRAQFEIINRNSSVIVDGVYLQALEGLILPRATLSNLRGVSQVDSVLSTAFSKGYVNEPDRLWSLPENAPEWARLKGALLTRIRISGISQHLLTGPLREARQLKQLVDAERNRSQRS
jgi:uncharacterized protein YkvS